MQIQNVYNRTQVRLKRIFSSFDNVYISFSGGKDSGVVLNLCIDYIRRHNLDVKLGVFHMDYEAQYRMTSDYVERVFEENEDILDIYRICVPFKVTTCASMHENYWRPWDEEKRDLWVREMPRDAYTIRDFPFYTSDMWDYEFQMEFARWLHERKEAKRTCCLVGIRTQESLNRWRTIYSAKFANHYYGLKWTKKLFEGVYNVYPIYDWKTSDVWTANGRYHWDYNQLYDLYYQAGVGIEKQRVASPFISAAQEHLKLFRVIDPDTWGKMVGRVNGANFSSLYGGTSAVGWHSIKLPPNHTWESYMHFLLSTLPMATRENYLNKLSVSIRFWKEKGGCLSDRTIQKLQSAGVEIELGTDTNYHTTKTPVRMEYLDDIDLPEFRELPTFKRICICILKNDHACKYMGFTPPKKEMEQKKAILAKYQRILT